MALRTDSFDLGGLRLTVGEGRSIELHVAIDPFLLGGERYRVQQPLVAARLDVSRIKGNGYALRLRFKATLEGPCMRCLEPATPSYEVDGREVSQAGGQDELASEYVHRGVLEVRSWARDALGLALPTKVLCRADCAGLCPVCGADLARAGPAHHHDPAPDARWAKLSELRFD